MLYQSSLNNLTLPMKMHINRTKTNLLILRVVKRLYYEKQIEKLKSNVKVTWKVLNEILNRNKGKRGLPSIFRADSREISNAKEIATFFCKYFTNIGPNLASKIPVSKKAHNSFLPPKLVNSILLDAVNEQEIIEICSTGMLTLPFQILF